MTVTEIHARLSGVKPSGSGWIAKCPAHDDRAPSLSIQEGADGRTLLKCHAGCTTPDIVRALGIEMSDLFLRAHLRPAVRRRLSSCR